MDGCVGGWLTDRQIYCIPGILCLLEARVCSGPERSFDFPYGPSSTEDREA